MKKTILLLLAIAPAALAADLTGRFDAGTKYEEPLAHAPANVSRMFARTVPHAAKATLALPATGNSGMIVWTIPARTNDKASIKTRLRTPKGEVLQPSDRGSLERGLRRFDLGAAETAELGLASGAQEVVHVLSTAAAAYHLDVEMTQDVAGAMIVVAEPESALTLATWAAPLSRQPGDPVTLHAELRDGDAAVTGAVVTARLASPDGRSFDAVALVEQGNGMYTATLAELPAAKPGAWQVRFEAEGMTPAGARFARTGSGELVSERGAARLGKLRFDIDGDSLHVRVPGEVFVAGTYRFDVVVADANRTALAWAEGVRAITRGGTMLEIAIPLAHLGETNRDSLFIDARLLGLDPIGVAGRVTN
jgi:hypothetical protein